MFTFIARLILRNRILLLSLVLLSSAFMAYQGQYVEVSFKFSRLLPKTDPVQVEYDDFRTRFNQVGNTIVIATDSLPVFTPENYTLWQGLQDSLLQIPGIESALSPINAFVLTRNDSAQKLSYRPLPSPSAQRSLEQIRQSFEKLPFYQSLLYSPDGESPLMLIQLDTTMLYDENIIRIVAKVGATVEYFEAQSGRDFKISGLPHIRMANTEKVKSEIYLLIGLAMLVTSLILYFFLRSFTAMFISMVVVTLGVCWSFGLMAILGYEISMLSSLVPTLVIIIGVPNCIFLINKYHLEFKEHGRRILALQRVIRKIGAATLMTNATTALGFAALILTQSAVLKEFGVVAAINILLVFVISLVLIPVYYSLKRTPKPRHYDHLEKRWIGRFIDLIIHTVMYHRRRVYMALFFLSVIAAVGMSKIYTTGNLSEEFKDSDPLLKDLHFIEKRFGGVVPLEIIVDTKRPRGVYAQSTLERIERLQRALDSIPGLSRSLSLTDGLKFAKQAYYRGAPRFYQLPTRQERNFIFSFLPEGDAGNGLLRSLVDSSGRYARITMQVRDMGKEESRYLQRELDQLLPEIFPPQRYDITVTGAWMVFQKGTTYLIRNLLISLSLAILVIALVMAFIFRSFAMVLVSLVPNIFPLLMTAGLMGYLGIPLKPSTILVFSVAFGISVDDTIHFLAKYRQELKQTRYNIGQSVLRAIRETGISMFYTSMVLFFGFSVFHASSFGGIVALGVLVSITLVIAMVGNLLLLPTLLLSFERLIIGRKFTEPYLTIYDEGEDDEEEEEVIKEE